MVALRTVRSRNRPLLTFAVLARVGDRGNLARSAASRLCSSTLRDGFQCEAALAGRKNKTAYPKVSRCFVGGGDLHTELETLRRMRIK